MAKKVLFGAAIVLASVASTDAGMSRDPSGGSGLVSRNTSFLDSLSEGYVALSRFRAGALDWIDAERFERKARHAASRISAHPDEVMDRDLPAADAAELDAVLSRLRASFDLGGRHLTPAQAAKAQVAYDCWVEAAEAHRRVDAALCKRAFEQAIVGVERAAEPKGSRDTGARAQGVGSGSGLDADPHPDSARAAGGAEALRGPFCLRQRGPRRGGGTGGRRRRGQGRELGCH